MYIKHFKLEINKDVNAELQKIAFTIHKQCLAEATNELYIQYRDILHEIEYETNQLLGIDEFFADWVKNEIIFDIDTIYEVHYSSRAFYKNHPFFIKYNSIKIFSDSTLIEVKRKSGDEFLIETDEKWVRMIKEFLTYIFPDNINRIVDYTLDREVDMLISNVEL